MHPQCGALPLPFVPVRVTRDVWLIIDTCIYMRLR